MFKPGVFILQADLEPVHLAGQPHCVPLIDHEVLGPGHEAGDAGGPRPRPRPGPGLVTHVVIQQAVPGAVGGP